MADFTVPTHGTICWRELATSDLRSAMDFYEQMFGWKLDRSKVSPVEYMEIHTGEQAVGGMMEINETWGENPPPSHWKAYVAVENCDASSAKISENGGTVHFGPFDAPGVGRMAMVADPCGAHFAIIQFESPS